MKFYFEAAEDGNKSSFIKQNMVKSVMDRNGVPFLGAIN